MLHLNKLNYQPLNICREHKGAYYDNLNPLRICMRYIILISLFLGACHSPIKAPIKSIDNELLYAIKNKKQEEEREKLKQELREKFHIRKDTKLDDRDYHLLRLLSKTFKEGADLSNLKVHIRTK